MTAPTILIVGRNEAHLARIRRALFPKLQTVKSSRWECVDPVDGTLYIFKAFESALTGMRFDRIITFGLMDLDMSRKRVHDAAVALDTYLDSGGEIFHL